MNSSIAVLCALVVVALVCLGGAQAVTSYTCWSCNSVSAPACVQTWGGSVGATVAVNCTCCTKSLSNNVWTRGCITNTGATDGVASCAANILTINSYTCFGNNCNAASSLRLPVKGAALLAAAALFLGVYRRQ